ncbi:MAG TPA: hypothetical protein VG815_15310 [Chloroflexota bacterium]|nr:hypothetical protein [Chloroflexota bacterium]
MVIGAFAALAAGAPIGPTRDIDITPELSHGNLTRLSAALADLDARVFTETVPEGLPFSHDPAPLGSVAVWNLVCSHGRLDIAFRPSGFDDGYTALVDRAVEVDIGGELIWIAGLDDIIRSKQAAGRPKDLQVLPILLRHQTGRSRH